MDLLNHQRDRTVIDGIRGEPFSLVDCVNCHAQTEADGTPVRIDAEGQFCESCHAFAAVKIDCFTCHAAKPEANELIGRHLPIEPQIDSLNTNLVANEQTNRFRELEERQSLDQYLSALDTFKISADAYVAESDERKRKARH